MIIILYRRKACIYQTQLTDFTGARTDEVYDMNLPKDYRLARKKFRWIPLQRNRGKEARHDSRIIAKSQKRIIDYLNWIPKLKGKYLYRFSRVKIPRFRVFGERVISKKEWDMHRYLKGFNGFFENLFEFNDFSFFGDLHERLENDGVSFKSMFIEDVFAYELLRVNLGIKDYTSLRQIIRFMGSPPLFSITHDPGFFPNAADLSFVLKRIPAHEIFNFFQLLVKECIDYGIIIPRILIWDGQFIRSNCNNNKNKYKNAYNDPDAGYCQHNGTKKGVGFDPGILYAYCFNRWFPIYFKMFPGNRSDYVAFKETLNEFLAGSKEEWQIVIADSGPYSLENLENVQLKGLIPIIRSRKNMKTHSVRELKKGFYFNTDFIPESWSDEFFLKIYSFRPMIEQGNSYNNTYYNAFRMNTRGVEAAIRLRATIYILVLLKALTAYKIGRPDLIMKPTAFEPSRYFNFRSQLPFLAEASGYKILKYSELQLRHKKYRYGRRPHHNGNNNKLKKNKEF